MNEIATETDCAANHPNHHWPRAEHLEAYKDSIFNCVVLQYDDGGFMVASADAKGIYGDGNSVDEATDDFRLAVECRVFDKQGGIYRGTSNEEFQRNYFYDLENDCEDGVKIVNKYQCTVKVFSFLQSYLDTLKANHITGESVTISNDADFTKYFDYLRKLKYPQKSLSLS